jgi:hypothetical protein
MAALDIKAYFRKQYFGEIGLGGVFSIIWLRGQTFWLAFVDTAIKFCFLQQTRNFMEEQRLLVFKNEFAP